MTFLEGAPQPVVGLINNWTGENSGFVENFKTTLADDNLRHAANGVEAALNDAWLANAQAFQKATGQSLHDQMIFRHTLLDGARLAEGNTPDAEEEEDVDRLTRFYDAHNKLEEYRRAHPEDTTVKTFSEMWEGVKGLNKDNIKTVKEVGARSTWLGTIGSFTASLVAGVNPETNFLNFMTLGIGGFGKSVLLRILGEAGAGAAIETVNQFTGVAERQELLGTPTTTGQKVAQIGLAGAGAGVLRGAFEGAPAAVRGIERKVAPQRAAAREILRDVETGSIAPTQRQLYEDGVGRLEPGELPRTIRPAVIAEQNYLAMTRANPFSDTSEGESLHWQRFQEAGRPVIKNFTESLKASTRMPEPMTPEYKFPDFDDMPTYTRTVAEANRNPMVVETARELDAPLINRYEDLAARREVMRGWMDDLGGRAREERIDRAVASIDEEIAAIRGKLKGRHASAKVKRSIEDLENQKTEIEAELRQGDTPDMQKVRNEITEIDNKLRDMSEEVSATFKRAREMTKAEEPRPVIGEGLRPHLERLVERNEISKTHPLSSAVRAMDPQMVNGRPLQESADNMVRDLNAFDERVPDMLEADTAAVRNTVDEEANTIDLGRGAGEVDLDTTMIQRSELEGDMVSLRKYLEENDLDDELLSGMTTCAIGSAT